MMNGDDDGELVEQMPDHSGFGEPKRPMNNAERQSLFRARQRDGIVVLPVPVRYDDLVGWLIDAGLLGETAALDQRRVIRACAEVLDALTTRTIP